jgi:peptidoglycan hydrolase CwlO-like protein
MSEITDKIKDKVIILSKDNNTRVIIIIVISIIAIISFAIIGFTYGKYNPDPNSQIVQELLNKMLSDEKLKYEQIINGKDIEINTINKQLELSMDKIKDNEKEIYKLKSKINNIKPPQNISEVKLRLKELGYETK